MRILIPALLGVVVILNSGFGRVSADSPEDDPAKFTSATVNPAAIDSQGSGGFNFEFGEWRVHHRVKRAGGDWLQFEGTCITRPLMEGTANVEDHTFNKPAGVTRGIALRAYDSGSRQWAIWWVDSRNPHGALDPPVKGSFNGGVGKFYSDSIVNGKPTRTRFLWSHVTPTSARWEQAYSTDAGKTWDTNWVMEFTRKEATQD